MADIVKLFDWNYILMSCDLHHAVSTCIYDKISCFNVMLAVIPDNIRAGISLVADYSPACRSGQLVEYFLREAFVICRERLW